MKKQSTTKGFAVLSMATLIVKLLSLLYIPLLIRIIGNEGYGIYAAAYDVFIFIYALTNSGMQTSISKQVAELLAVHNSRDALKTFKISLAILSAMGVGMTVLLIIFTRPIAIYTGNPQSYSAIIFLAPAVVLTSILSSFRGYFQGMSLMTPTAISQIVEHIINVIVSLIFAKILFTSLGVSFGAAGGTLGTVFGALIAGIYLMYIYRKLKSIRHKSSPIKQVSEGLSNKRIVKNLFKYGIPITLCSGLQYLGGLIDLAIIKNRLFLAGFDEKNGNIQYGLLCQYKSLINIPIAIISALCVSIIPSLSKAVVLGDRTAIKNKINFSFKITFIISIPCSIGFSVLSDGIYRILYGNTYGHELLMYGSMLVILMSIVQIQTIILQCTNKLYPVLLSLSLGITCKLILNYTLVANPKLNIFGAVIGNLVCFAIPMIINNIIIKKALNVYTDLAKQSLKPIISALIMGLVVKLINIPLHYVFYSLGSGYLLSIIPDIISILIGAIIYGYIMILIGGITKEDLNVLPVKITKLTPNFINKILK